MCRSSYVSGGHSCSVLWHIVIWTVWPFSVQVQVCSFGMGSVLAPGCWRGGREMVLPHTPPWCYCWHWYWSQRRSRGSTGGAHLQGCLSLQEQSSHMAVLHSFSGSLSQVTRHGMQHQLIPPCPRMLSEAASVGVGCCEYSSATCCKSVVGIGGGGQQSSPATPSPVPGAFDPLPSFRSATDRLAFPGGFSDGREL